MNGNFRIGFGYDVHRFAENRKCIIGGVEIPSDKGLLGHSDADVLSHAIADAVLGAAALPDLLRKSIPIRRRAIMLRWTLTATI